MIEKHSEQIERIKKKLVKAKKVDKKLKVFGAKSHKYKIGPTLSILNIEKFETEHSIELPDCYKAFLWGVGSGGGSFALSSAGPFYGIYPLGYGIYEIVEDNPSISLSGEALLKPNMSDDEWSLLTKPFDNDDISDGLYYREMDKLYAGILPIGSQGCTLLHALVVTGDHKGRVVNLDIDRHKPLFAHEANYLDWYERWLDEIISGWLLVEQPTIFGFSIREGS